MNNLEKRFEELRQYNRKFNESRDEATREEASIHVDVTRNDIEELVANEIYDKLTILLNNTRKRLGIRNVKPIDPIRRYDSFKLADNGELTYVYKRTVIDLDNINERMKSPSEIRKLGVTNLRWMGFENITDEDIQPHRKRHVRARKKLRKLNDTLNERSKAIESLSTMDTEAIEMIEITSNDIDTTVKGVEQDTSFIKPDDKDMLLPLRELEGFDK